ncbi:hypothetical protein NL676_001788 [Syzygium grande]|nr:hypothetical protein NL676_001788 [Syzygium grande]
MLGQNKPAGTSRKSTIRLLFTFSQRTVPPLSTSLHAEPGNASLQGSHSDPSKKKGIIEDALIGEIPKMPIELAKHEWTS